MNFVLKKDAINSLSSIGISILILFSLFFAKEGSMLITIASFLIFIIVAISNLEYNTYYLFMLLPYYMFLLIKGNQLYNLVIILFVAKYFLVNIRKIKLHIFVLPVVLAAIELIYIAKYGLSADLIKWLMTATALSILIVDPNKNLELKKIIKYFVLGILFVSMSVLVHNWSSITSVSSRNHIEGIASIEKNTYALYCCVSLMSILYLLQCNFKSNRKFLFPFVIIVASAILMISKTFFLVFSACLIIYVLASVKNPKFTAAFIFIMVALVVFIISNSYLRSVVFIYLNRFNEGDLNDLTTGRLDIFIEYINYLLKHPKTLLVGEGLFSYMNTVYKNFQIPMRPHNVELELLMGWGIGGTFIIGYILNKYFRRSQMKNGRYKSIFAVLPLIAMILSLQSITLIYQNITLIIIAYCLYIIIFNKHGRKWVSDATKV